MPKKSLGQYFLYDPVIIEAIIQAAQLEPDDLVVEIGPGPGSLTKRLAEKVQHLIAIELDNALYGKLTTKFTGYGNVELIRGDALEYQYENLPAFKAVANIPYYITTPIIFRLLDARKNLKSMTLTIQKEVAERIVAKPGGKEYGVLSIMVQYYADCSLQFIIPKEAFRPSPKVDSAVVHMRILDKPSVAVRDEKQFFRIVRAAFSQRRKMLSNSLKTLHEDVPGWLRKTGIDPQRRPETLSMEELASLADTFDFS
jgi:16S rRNA (adenine1518-N6/adenine1519-N6)-dimethyltransferase